MRFSWAAIFSKRCAVNFSAQLRKTHQTFLSADSTDILSTFHAHLSHVLSTPSSHEIRNQILLQRNKVRNFRRHFSIN